LQNSLFNSQADIAFQQFFVFPVMLHYFVKIENPNFFYVERDN